MKFTVFGATGFIGRNITAYLEKQGHTVWSPSRSGKETHGHNLGHVIYAIGLTGDFRSKPFDTVEAHVCKLRELLKSTIFDSWLYLSSTRIYEGLPLNTKASEDTSLEIQPDLDLYNISKLMGEALCLSLPNKKIRIARLSNVYGIGQSQHTFLALVLSELLNSGNVLIRESSDSCKDYMSLSDVIPLLETIAVTGQERIYNVASGKNLQHSELAEKLMNLTNCFVQFAQEASCRKFPCIDISRIHNEFGFVASEMDEQLSVLIANTKL
ncbi:MAG: NAD(P)-dependent oxidoreductase [Candidatus Electrothrix sp. AW3_4]|nr:NAD(P)-dependent oxidoreductase [Candidatus Electrothrix gigas]